MNKRKPILSLADAKSKKLQDPVKKFKTSIRAKATLQTYRKTFTEFLSSVKEFDGTFEEMARQFYDYARENPENAQTLLESYAMYVNSRASKSKDSEDYLNPNSFKGKFKGIKKFCKTNRIQILWNDIDVYEPESNNNKPTRGFTTEEIRKVLDCSTSAQMDFVILALSSCGARAGEWEELRWENISPVYAENDKYSFQPSDFENPKIVCACVIIYAGTKSEYRTLISIEAYDKLQAVHEQWTSRMNREPRPDDLILLTRYNDNRPYSGSAIRNKVRKLVDKANFRTKNDNERRYDCPATHSFRKRCNKIMVEHTGKSDSHANHIRKERLLGHKIAISNLEQSYFYNDIMESVPQYLEVMPELMITEEYRAKWKLQKEEQKTTHLERSLKEKEDALDIVEELTAKVTRMEKYQQKAD